MLSYNTFLKTGIQHLYAGLFFSEKVLGMLVQLMLEISGCLYTRKKLYKMLGIIDMKLVALDASFTYFDKLMIVSNSSFCNIFCDPCSYGNGFFLHPQNIG